MSLIPFRASNQYHNHGTQFEEDVKETANYNENLNYLRSIKVFVCADCHELIEGNAQRNENHYREEAENASEPSIVGFDFSSTSVRLNHLAKEY